MSLGFHHAVPAIGLGWPMLRQFVRIDFAVLRQVEIRIASNSCLNPFLPGSRRSPEYLYRVTNLCPLRFEKRQ